MGGNCYLAQANIARMRAPLDSVVMQGFVDRLEPLNVLADSMPGFVWRLQTDEGDATSVQIFDDSQIIVNMSVWQSMAALEEFVYRSDHVAALQKRAEWFERPDKPPLVLWWIEPNHIPTIQEAEDRFKQLWQDGPTAEAFTFRTRFEPPDKAT